MVGRKPWRQRSVSDFPWITNRATGDRHWRRHDRDRRHRTLGHVSDTRFASLAMNWIRRRAFHAQNYNRLIGDPRQNGFKIKIARRSGRGRGREMEVRDAICVADSEYGARAFMEIREPCQESGGTDC